MAATSTEGTGPGAAFPGQKGPGNNRNIFLSIAGSSNVIATGFLDAVGGIGTEVVTATFIEPLEGSGLSHEVILHRSSGSGAEILLADIKTDDADGNFASFTVSVSGDTDYQFMVYRNLPRLPNPTIST